MLQFIETVSRRHASNNNNNNSKQVDDDDNDDDGVSIRGLLSCNLNL
jgi:hypothetical protein